MNHQEAKNSGQNKPPVPNNKIVDSVQREPSGQDNQLKRSLTNLEDKLTKHSEVKRKTLGDITNNSRKGKPIILWASVIKK